MRLAMPKTIHWSDGTDWTVDDTTFGRAIDCLEAVREPVWGFGPLLDRLKRLSEEAPERIDVDAVAPSEDERAIVTAALERAVEHAKQQGAEALGYEEPADFAAFVQSLSRLHELFVTDVTRSS